MNTLSESLLQNYKEGVVNDKQPTAASTASDELTRLINMVEAVEAAEVYPEEEVTSFRIKKMKERQQYRRKLKTTDQKLKTLMEKRKFYVECIDNCNRFL